MAILSILMAGILILLIINLSFSFKNNREVLEKLAFLEEKFFECQKYFEYLESLENLGQKKNEKVFSEMNFSRVMSRQIKNKEYEDMFEDYQKGVSVTEIARKYNKGKGEVELILSLKK